MTDELEQLMEEESREVEEPTGSVAQLVALAQEMNRLRLQLDLLDVERTQLQREYDELRKVKIPDEMQRLGLSGKDGRGSFSLADGSKVFLRANVHASVDKARVHEFHDFLRNNNLGAMIQESVHPQTLKAWAKEWVEEGRELPSCLRQYVESTAVLSQPKKKEQ